MSQYNSKAFNRPGSLKTFKGQHKLQFTCWFKNCGVWWTWNLYLSFMLPEQQQKMNNWAKMKIMKLNILRLNAKGPKHVIPGHVTSL